MRDQRPVQCSMYGLVLNAQSCPVQHLAEPPVPVIGDVSPVHDLPEKVPTEVFFLRAECLIIMCTALQEETACIRLDVYQLLAPEKGFGLCSRDFVFF